MAEPHLDNPGEIRWFKGEGPAPVLGPCPHTACKHNGQSVIAWGPSYDRYELVDCGSLNPADESDSDCAGQCRAWVDGQGRVVTAWLNVDRSERYPIGGCVLVDKTRCKLRMALCCDQGRAARIEQQVRMVDHGRALLAGYDCPDHPGPLDDARNHICRMRPVTPDGD